MIASYALLGILGRQPSHGYDLKRYYDTLFGHQKPLAFGQVYATLYRLLRDKKIAVETGERGTGPERKKYTLTPSGRRELESWLQLPENLHHNAQSVLFMKVVTAILIDASPDIYLDAQRASHVAQMRELVGTRRTGDLAQSLQADYALFHLEADLRWIDLTAARLGKLTKEIQNER
jgi:DNA-binding PadR family transcriptional regulator